MEKKCKNCKYLSRDTSHLATEFLKQSVVNDPKLYTCTFKGHLHFTSTWAFGLPDAPFDEPICAGNYFEPKVLQASLF